MMGLRPLAGCALGAHVSPRRVGQRAPGASTRGAQRGPNSSSQHAAEIIYVAMVELETEAQRYLLCAKTGAQTDRERGLIRQSGPQLVASAAANSPDRKVRRMGMARGDIDHEHIYPHHCHPLVRAARAAPSPPHCSHLPK